MKLSEFMEETGITIRKFCDRADISPLCFYRIIHGQDIRLSTAVRIQKATKDRVSCAEIFYECIENKNTPQKKKNKKTTT